MRKRLNIMIAINLVIVAAMAVILIRTAADQYDRHKMKTYTIGTNNRVGDIGVQLVCDKEPVKLELIDPEGHTVDVNHGNYSTKGNTIMLTITTQKIGTWKARWNTLSNDKVQYAFIEHPSETIMISTYEVTPDEDKHQITVKFTAAYGEPTETDTDIYYNLTMEETKAYGMSIPMKGGYCKSNTPTTVVLKDTEMESGNWELRLNVSLHDKKGNITASDKKGFNFEYTKKKLTKAEKKKATKKKKSSSKKKTSSKKKK